MDPVAVERPPVRVPQPDTTPRQPPVDEPVERIAPPEVAYAHGWMAVSSTGADRFLRTHPTYDGRGVLIGILDTGIDPSIPGLITTSTGEPKLVDFRDFSGEGAVPLTRATPRGDTIAVNGTRLRGFGRVAALNPEGPWYMGSIAEIPLGDPPASDLNGNGSVADILPLVVTRATDGWVVIADGDGDGSLSGERAVRDYLVAREWFGWAPRGRAPRMGVAANFSDNGGEPSLVLAFDLYAHGSHVAGIAAANDLYGVEGFDGAAPGARLLGLKISNSAQGSVSTTGAMLRAMDYAIRFAESRRQALVLNLSFGVGNEIEGGSRIDRIIDSVLAQNPSVVMTVAAGNDGPGLSTVGFPGSADRAITVGATLPLSFLPPPPRGVVVEERVAYFSGRGGQLAKPDLIAPGVAYSSVPRWNAGDEVKQGTSMATPHVAGLAAQLLSAAVQERKAVSAAQVKRALMVTARAEPALAFVEEGRGLPVLEAAYRWLGDGRAVSEVLVRVAGTARTGAWIERLPGAAVDSGVRFELLRPDTAAPATFALRSDVPWLRPPSKVTLSGASAEVNVPYATRTLLRPGAYSGTVSGWGADTLVGPAFRLVVTVVVPARAPSDSAVLRAGTAVTAGSVLRSFFLAESMRPFEVEVQTGAGSQAIAFLHEPDGQPFRDGATAPAGGEPASFAVGGRDARRGMYEVDVTPAPNREVRATVTVHHAPYTIRASRSGGDVVARLTGAGSTSEAELKLGLIGAERADELRARGSAERRIPFVLPAWATAVVVDVSMDRSQWGRFTDFGVTLFDSTGRQLGKDPLDYAFGRLSVDVTKGQADRPVALGFFPGFADPADDGDWNVNVSIRLYADSSVALAPVGGETSRVTVAAGSTVTRRFALPESPWPLSEGFFPLGVVLARSGGRLWTAEAALPPAPGSAAR